MTIEGEIRIWAGMPERISLFLTGRTGGGPEFNTQNQHYIAGHGLTVQAQRTNDPLS